MKSQKSWILSCAMVFLSSSLFANDGDPLEPPVEMPQENKKIILDQDTINKINEYNGNYIQFIEKHAGWDKRLEMALDKVNLAKIAYETLMDQSSPALKYYEHVKFDLESQVAHLEFLKSVEPVATDVQKGTQQDVVNSGWFSTIEQVTTFSLTEKITSQTNIIDDLRSKIGVEDAKILAIKTGPDYIAVDSSLAGAKAELATARWNLSESERLKSEYEWELEQQELALEESNSRITEAQTRIIVIDSSELKTVELKLVQNERAQEQLKQPIRDAKRKVKRISERIGETETKISGLQIAIDALGDSEEVQGKVAKLEEEKADQEEKLGKQQGNLATAERELSDLNEELDELVTAQFDLEGIRDGLEREKLDLNATIGEEQIDQISINAAISSYTSLIADEDLKIITYSVDVEFAGLKVSTAQTAFNKFNTDNIEPIEDVISGLAANKRNEEFKRTQLQTWLGEIRRQDTNMAAASDKIAAQLKVIEEREVEMNEAESVYSEVMEGLGQKKAAANTSIQAYNEIVDEIESSTARYNELKEEVINLEINVLENEE